MEIPIPNEVRPVPLRGVLILTFHFPPSSASGSFRMLGFARHLPHFGWRAVVVAPPCLPWEPTDDGLCGRIPKDTEVYYVPYLGNRLVRSVAPFCGWLAIASRACAKAIREHRPEVVLTSGPPHQVHWLGLWLKFRYGLSLVVDFRDPWYPQRPNRFGRRVFEWLAGVRQAVVVRRADAVVANAPAASLSLRNSHPGIADRVVTLPNGFDVETFDGLPGPPPRPPARPVRVVHAGAIYFGRDPRPFLDAMRDLVESGHQVEAVFFGPAPEGGIDLATEAETRGLTGRVSFEGPAPYSHVIREMAAADVNLLLDTPGRAVGVPAKLYEYIGAGRPILALAERSRDLLWALESSPVPHRIVPPGDPAAITEALLALVSETGNGGAAWRNNGGPFTRTAIAGRLAEVLDRCATGWTADGRRRRMPPRRPK